MYTTALLFFTAGDQTLVKNDKKVLSMRKYQCAGKRTAAVFLASGRRPEARKTAASARRAEAPLGPKGLVASGAVPRGPKGRVA